MADIKAMMIRREPRDSRKLCPLSRGEVGAQDTALSNIDHIRAGPHPTTDLENDQPAPIWGKAKIYHRAQRHLLQYPFATGRKIVQFDAVGSGNSGQQIGLGRE